MRIIIAIALAIVCGCVKASQAETVSPPPPPPAEVPELGQVDPPILCVDCNQPFDTETHKELLKDLVSNRYASEFRKGLYFQDILHQFESKAHFDNCDFEASMDYIGTLLAEAEQHVKAAQIAKASNEAAVMEAAGRSAFLALGRAVHGVQDFYAHTNYVELATPKVKKVTDLEIIFPWRPEGRARVKELIQQGLVSGYVFWGFPQLCAKGTPSHGELAKDSADTKSGKRLVGHLQNLSQYRIAVFLAREASLAFMTDAFRRWPLLKELNGQAIPMDVLIDRRGLEGKT